MHTSNDYIYVLMPSVSLLFLAGLLGVLGDPTPTTFLFWLCTAYLLTATSIGIRSVLKLELLNHYVVPVNALFLVGAWCMAKSFSVRRGVLMPRCRLRQCASPPWRRFITLSRLRPVWWGEFKLSVLGLHWFFCCRCRQS